MWISSNSLTCEVSSEGRIASSRQGSYLLIKSEAGHVSNSVSLFFQAPPHLDRASVITGKYKKRVTLLGTNLGESKKGWCVFNSGYLSRLEMVGSNFSCTVPNAIVQSGELTSTLSVAVEGQSSNILTFTI